MSEYQEFTGKTVEEALKNAREEFGVSGLQDLDFEILTQGSRGVLGMGAEPARIIAAPRSALGGARPRKEPAPATAPPPPSAPSVAPTTTTPGRIAPDHAESEPAARRAIELSQAAPPKQRARVLRQLDASPGRR